MRRKEFLLLAGPSALIMTVLLVVPLIQTIIWSLQNITYGQQGIWTGLSNYVDVLSDGLFRQAVVFTIALTLVGLAFKLVLGFFLAVLLQRTGRARPLFLGFLLLSYIVPTVIGAVAFSWLFDSNFGGLINWVLQHVGVSNPPLWFADQWPNRIMVLANIIWHELPFSILILLAGLQGVNTEAIEAAADRRGQLVAAAALRRHPVARPADRLHLAHHDHGRPAHLRRAHPALAERGLPGQRVRDALRLQRGLRRR